jgi:hypothetical protein
MRTRRSLRTLLGVAGLAVVLGATACSGDDDTTEATSAGEAGEGGEGVEEPELREELLELMDADQAERTGEVGGNDDIDRTQRLQEIIDEHGWPGFDLVGKEGATAAWVIAQHSDQDVDFQEQALELMQDAVDDDQADPSELAYLDDRVAVNNERPQRYGTQVRCGPGGAVPATPLVDPEGVDELRAAVDLDPLDDYLAEFAKGCSEEPIQTG